MRAGTKTLDALPILFLAAALGWSGCDQYTDSGDQAVSSGRAAKVAPIYEVDPQWPQRPPEAKWGEMPGVAVDSKDQVWLFTREKPPVQVYDAQGKFVRAWGGDAIQTAHYIRFDRAGNVWVADVGQHVVMQFTPEGKLLKTLGTPGQPGCDGKHLNKPTDMVVTPAGDVFVSDGYGNSRVAHFDKDGNFVKAWGKNGRGPGEFDLPHSIVVDSKGTLYVADRSNSRVQVFDQSGKFLAKWEGLLVPWGLWITGKDEIWACGSSPMPRPADDRMPYLPPKDQVLMRFDTAGKVLALWTFPCGLDGKEQPGQLNWLHGVSVDSKGNLYLTDIHGHRAQKFLLRN
ncbi:MAG: peptidyl-alpha-hydroxyglycine alpha-amidating lyase family protein [Planctomycetota bacterium]